MEAQINNLYSAHARSYLGRHGTDVTITVLVVAAVLVYVAGTSYSAIMKQAKTNWAQNKCDPIYMPFAGAIMPQPGQSYATTNAQNFDYCMQKDFSGFISVLLMPLEYVAFLILTSVDVLLNITLLSLKLMSALKFSVAKSNESLSDKLHKVAGPLVVTVAKFRDALAKVNATVLTAVYTSLTVYDIIQSGILNVLTITVDLLISIVAVIEVMFVVAIVLIMTPAFPIGIALFTVASTAVYAVVIPTIVIYALLHAFVKEVFGQKAANVPGRPKVPKMPKPPFQNIVKNVFKPVADAAKSVGKGIKNAFDPKKDKKKKK
jgi:hypothetical protein